MKGVGKQLAAMNLARELDPLEAFGNERVTAHSRKRDRSALERLVGHIIRNRPAQGDLALLVAAAPGRGRMH